MRKWLVGLAVFTVTLNVGYLLYTNIQSFTIAAKVKEGPKVRVPNIHPEVIEKTKAITVLISNEGFGGIGRGTGVLIDSLHVLTCAHLIQSWEDDLYLYLYDGSFVKGKPMAANKKKDLAIILLDRPVKVPAVAVFAENTRAGEPLAIIGNSLGAMKWYVSGGVISGYHEEWILTDAFQIGGNSGGPWINAKGEIIAIAAWGLQDRRGQKIGINGGIGAKPIQKFICEVKNPPTTLMELLRGNNVCQK